MSTGKRQVLFLAPLCLFLASCQTQEAAQTTDAESAYKASFR